VSRFCEAVTRAQSAFQPRAEWRRRKPNTKCVSERIHSRYINQIIAVDSPRMIFSFPNVVFEGTVLIITIIKLYLQQYGVLQ
jgi:hypothetical protein